jgi:hypothetical protein
MRNAYTVLIGKYERKGPLDRRRRRWEDIINVDLKERVCEDVNRIHLAYNMIR